MIPGLGRSPGGGHGNPVFLPGESPRTEEAGGLQSMGSQRVGHDLATKGQHSTDLSWLDSTGLSVPEEWCVTSKARLKGQCVFDVVLSRDTPI